MKGEIHYEAWDSVHLGKAPVPLTGIGDKLDRFSQLPHC